MPSTPLVFTLPLTHPNMSLLRVIGWSTFSPSVQLISLSGVLAARPLFECDLVLPPLHLVAPPSPPRARRCPPPPSRPGGLFSQSTLRVSRGRRPGTVFSPDGSILSFHANFSTIFISSRPIFSPPLLTRLNPEKIQDLHELLTFTSPPLNP